MDVSPSRDFATSAKCAMAPPHRSAADTKKLAKPETKKKGS
jgi:hypothetical protein